LKDERYKIISESKILTKPQVASCSVDGEQIQSETSKKIKQLSKKLRQIAELESKPNLNQQEMIKVAQKQELENKLKILKS
jgi:hypothetical protein